MNSQLIAILFALASFVAAFTAGRLVMRWMKKRQAREDQARLAAQSRQVRRARGRRNAK